VNYVVQKMPNSSMEIMHIDRLTLFHGTVTKPWKQVLRNRLLQKNLLVRTRLALAPEMQKRRALKTQLACQSERQLMQIMVCGT